MSSPRVSVVVVNWNTSSLLRACLASVARAAETCPLECIVVDNGSADSSAEMVESEFPTFRLIRNETNVGFAKANNQAFEEARGEYVLMLNSDAILHDEALLTSIDHADRHPRTGIVGGHQTDAEGRDLPAGMRFPRLFGVALAATGLPILFPNNRILNWERYGGRRSEEPRPVEFVMGSFLLVRRRILDEVGFLDPRFFVYGEEADLCRRASQGGHLVEQLHVPVVRHSIGGSGRATRITAWVHEAKQRGILLFLHKWNGLPTAWIANLLMLAGLAPRALLWFPVDVVSRVRGRTPAWSRLAKLRILPYHLAAVLQPDRLTKTIDPPRPVTSKTPRDRAARTPPQSEARLP